MDSNTNTKKKREHIDISFDSSSPPSSPSSPIPLRQIGLFPAPGDNCAILTKKVDGGTKVLLPDNHTEGNEGFVVKLSHSVLEGHRICAVKEGIKKGEPLLSWGLPFGIALRDILPGIIFQQKFIHLFIYIFVYLFRRVCMQSKRIVKFT